MTDTSHAVPGPDPDARERAGTNPADTVLQARAALRDVVPELVTLVRSIPDAESASVGTWTAGDVAAHLSHFLRADTDAIADRPVPEAVVTKQAWPRRARGFWPRTANGTQPHSRIASAHWRAKGSSPLGGASLEAPRMLTAISLP